MELNVGEVIVLVSAAVDHAVRIRKSNPSMAFLMADTNEKLVTRIMDEHPDLTGKPKELLDTLKAMCDDILDNSLVSFDPETEQVVIRS